jgi:hypothetical protein
VRTRITIGKKTAWWNRQLRWRLWSTLVGFAIGILIASRIARWLVILVVALGCLFAIAFRLARRDDEI